MERKHVYVATIKNAGRRPAVCLFYAGEYVQFIPYYPHNFLVIQSLVSHY